MHFIQIDKLGANRYQATDVAIADEDEHHSRAGASSRGSLTSILHDIESMGITRTGELNLLEIHGKDDYAIWQVEVPYTFIQNRLERGVRFTGTSSGLGTYLVVCQDAIGSHALLDGRNQTEHSAPEQDTEPDITM